MTEREAARAARAEQRKILAERTAFMRATRDRIVALLNHALEEIKVTLAGAPTDYQQWSLPQLKREIELTLETFKAGAGAEMSAAAGKMWALGATSVEAPLVAAGARLVGVLPMIDTRQLLAMRAFMVDRIRDIGVQAANRIGNELGLVVIGTQSPSEAITNVTQILGEPSRTRTTTIVRTELGRTFAVARFEDLVRSAAKVPGLKKQWRKSGKVHPRLTHAAIDGQIQEVGDPFLLDGGRVKLLHPHDPKAPASEVINCGCVMLPWNADWKMAKPGGSPGAVGDDPVPIAQIVGLREAKNTAKFQARVPAGQHGGGRFAGKDPIGEAAYAEAKAGGAHHGMLARYTRESPRALSHAERSFTERIAEHERWIKDPASKTSVGPALSDANPALYVNVKWPRDVDRLIRQRGIIRGLLREKLKKRGGQ